MTSSRPILAALLLLGVSAAPQKGSVQQITRPRETAKAPLQTELVSPVRVALAPNGELLVTDSKLRKVLRLDAETLRVRQEIDVDGRPLAIGAYGNRIFVGNRTTRSIEVRADSGRLLGALGGGAVDLGHPTDLAIDSLAGLLFAVDGEAGEVRVFDLDASVLGQAVGVIGSKGTVSATFQNPTGICVDPIAQEVFVADYGRLTSSPKARVLVFDYDGTFEELVWGWDGSSTPPFSRPQGLALGTQPGHLLVVDSWRGMVVVMNRADDTEVATVGVYGRAPGELLLPMDALVLGTGADLVVLSNRTGRIEVFPGGGAL